MPKNIIKKKNESGVIKVTRPPSKFRIGSRKGGKSALMMTNDELQNVLNNPGQKRYHANAAAVLKMRGIQLQNEQDFL